MWVTNIAEDMMEIEMITAKIDLEIPIRMQHCHHTATDGAEF